MSSNQRSEVWRGIRKKTSGGLTKEHLTKNKRGKIVSKKKSMQASSQNNLGSWLREKGKKVEKTDMLRKKAAPPKDAPISKRPKKPKKSKVKVKKEVPKAAPKPKPAPKAAPKPTVSKPKKQAPVVREKTKAPTKRKKLKKKSNINPLTQQPYDKKNRSGYVEKGAVSLDNVKRGKLRTKPQKAASGDYSSYGDYGAF